MSGEGDGRFIGYFPYIYRDTSGDHGFWRGMMTNTDEHHEFRAAS
jgi:hypothetical protein